MELLKPLMDSLPIWSRIFGLGQLPAVEIKKILESFDIRYDRLLVAARDDKTLNGWGWIAFATLQDRDKAVSALARERPVWRVTASGV